VPHLLLDDGSGKSSVWTTGALRVDILDDADQSRTYPISVQCQLGSMEESHTALLDTGSQYTIISSEIAEVLEDELGTPLYPDEIRLGSRLGGRRLTGHLHRLDIRLLSLPEYGADLEIAAKVIVVENWHHIVLGIIGFLEVLRFGIEPSRDSLMYFGLRP